MTTTTVGNLPNYLTLVSDSQDVAAIRAHLGPTAADTATDYDAFFVNVVDGDYSEVWGIVGIVPYNNKLATLVWPLA